MYLNANPVQRSSFCRDEHDDTGTAQVVAQRTTKAIKFFSEPGPQHMIIVLFEICVTQFCVRRSKRGTIKPLLIYREVVRVKILK